MEIAEPKRPNVRQLIAEPTETKSKRDSAEPRRDIPKTLMVLPRRQKLRKLRLEPSDTKSSTLNDDPSRAIP
jgi:hypothetical protein